MDATPPAAAMPTAELHLDRVTERLRAHRPSEVSRLVAPRRAAVAALLRFGEDGAAGPPQVLVMKRAEREGDRWSGHVSLPGGMEETRDGDLMRTAIRETAEEVGLDLDRIARPLGRISDVRAIARGKALPMAITPYVFAEVESAPLQLNHEAEDAFWLPLGEVLAGSLDDTVKVDIGPVPLTLGSWRYSGYVVWGLTYKILGELLQIIAPQRR